jgi:exodeoxyribonuclease VII large subunit
MDAETENRELTFTPGAVLTIFNNSLSPGGVRKIIQLRGIFQQRSQNNYNGMMYGSLKDETSDALLTVIVPAIIFPKLEPGKVVTVNGFVNKKVVTNGSRIDIQFQITELIAQSQGNFSHKDILVAGLLQEKAARGYRDVQSWIKERIINEEPFKVAVIIGVTAIIQNDIKHQLRESIGYYDLTFHKVSLSSETEIALAANRLDKENYDIIAISRGGGENLEVFNSPDLAKKLIELDALLVAAIGHKDDVTLVQKIADKAFITPSEFGQFLNDTYNHTKEELEHSKAKLVESVTLQLKAQYQKQVDSLVQLNAKAIADLEKVTSANIDAVKKQAVEERAGLKRVQDQQLSMVNQRITELQKETKSKEDLLKSYKTQLAEVQSKSSTNLVAIIIAVIVGIILGFIFSRK